MNTIINSQKKEITGAFSHYEQYKKIWLEDKEKAVDLFLSNNPTLDEFEQKMVAYKEIEKKVQMEDEYMNVGSICLLTGTLYFYANFFLTFK